MTPPPLDATDLQWLTRLAGALVRDPHAADDLAQETLVAAIEAPIPPEAPRRAWLASVARRLAARRYRGDSRRARRERKAGRDEALPDSADLVARAEVAELLAAAAQRLPEPYRHTILLRFLEGRSPAEIAADQDLPADTVRWRVRRGLALLREDLTRSHPRDWSAWCALLLPLARSGGDAGLATAGTTGALTATVAAWTTMKLTTIGVAALGAGLWLAWTLTDETDEVAPPADVARIDATAPSQPAMDPPLPPGTGTGAVEPLAAPDAPLSTQAPTPAAVTPSITGRVVDEAGSAVVGATVYVVPSQVDADTSDPLTPSLLTETDDGGRFRLDLTAHAGASIERDDVQLGASANGFLRRLVPARPTTAEDEEMLIVLDRGQVLSGRVVDADGLPVPGLELLAHTATTRLAHVSPTQVLLRAGRAELAGEASTYQQCRALTDGRGLVDFEGLGPGAVSVRSVDPGWTIEEPAEAQAGGPFVEWLARPRLGVSVTVTDETTGAAAGRVHATFRVELTFADGVVEDLGQWVGRGDGGASFVLGPGTFIDLGERTVVRAAFYGTATSNDVEVPWEAGVLSDPDGVRGVAFAEVSIPDEPTAVAGTDTGANTPVDAAPSVDARRPETDLELDVRLADGTPFAGELAARWTSQPERGEARQGARRIEAEAPGTYRLSVDAGTVELEVWDPAASGSLPPWSGNVRSDAGWNTRVEVVLPQGAAVTLTRPTDWSGDWWVHASWRPPGKAEWRGSWIYGTDEASLRLTTLRPAEWRFRLDRIPEPGPDALVRTVRVSAWDDVVVD